MRGMENYKYENPLQEAQPHCNKVFINRDISVIGTDIKI